MLTLETIRFKNDTAKRRRLFVAERRVNSPASGNRKSLRKPLGQGYTRKAAP